MLSSSSHRTLIRTSSRCTLIPCSISISNVCPMNARRFGYCTATQASPIAGRCGPVVPAPPSRNGLRTVGADFSSVSLRQCDGLPDDSFGSNKQRRSSLPRRLAAVVDKNEPQLLLGKGDLVVVRAEQPHLLHNDKVSRARRGTTGARLPMNENRKCDPVLGVGLSRDVAENLADQLSMGGVPCLQADLLHDRLVCCDLTGSGQTLQRRPNRHHAFVRGFHVAVQAHCTNEPGSADNHLLVAADDDPTINFGPRRQEGRLRSGPERQPRIAARRRGAPRRRADSQAVQRLRDQPCRNSRWRSWAHRDQDNNGHPQRRVAPRTPYKSWLERPRQR